MRDWYTGNYRQIDNTKLGHMDKNGFENVIAEFAPSDLKPLARDLRNVLFPIRGGAIFTGAFRNSGDNVRWDDRGVQQGNWPSWQRGPGISIVRRMVCYKGFGGSCTI